MPGVQVHKSDTLSPDHSEDGEGTDSAIVSYRDFFRLHLSQREFRMLSELVTTHCGIKMPAPKKTMLESRLRKRLRALGIRTFSRYCDYLLSPDGMKNELVHMIDCVTTNKTDFFREPNHFTYLMNSALPDILSRPERNPLSRLTVWSAGCASGEEPYTLAMFLQEFRAFHSDFQYDIVATDISSRVLEKAQKGIYSMEKAAPIPDKLRKKYLLRSRDESKHLVRIIPELRMRVRFRRVNFLDSTYSIPNPIDVIFCRNVIIYFERKMQQQILQKICLHLDNGGYLFVGHSESLHGMDLPLVQVTSSVYKKNGAGQ